jgi:hypothetical protein
MLNQEKDLRNKINLIPNDLGLTVLQRRKTFVLYVSTNKQSTR